MNTSAIPQLKASYLTAEDMKIASSILFNAYHDDPFFYQCFDGQLAGYEQRLRAAIREELTVFWERDQPIIGVYDSDEHLVGVTCLVEPNANFGAERFWHWRLKMMLTAGFVSTKNMIEKERMIREALSDEHYYLIAFIAVLPSMQSHGVGHYLLGAIDSLIEEHKTAEGVGVLVTVDKYLNFFEDCKYTKVQNLTVGHVSASLMYKAR